MEIRHTTRIFYSVILLIVAQLTTAQTTLTGGEIEGTLTKVNSPYTVTGDLTVPIGEQLTIEPGVEMYFDQHVKLTVKGLMTAKGTAEDSIIFTASDPDLGWYGIHIRNDYRNEEEFTFSYCRFSRAYRIITPPLTSSVA